MSRITELANALDVDLPGAPNGKEKKLTFIMDASPKERLSVMVSDKWIPVRPGAQLFRGRGDYYHRPPMIAEALYGVP